MSDELYEHAIDRARAGDSLAFDELVRLLERPLVGFARAGGADDPEGVVNDALVRAFRQIEGFEGNAAQFRAWVFRITRNLLIDERRRSGRRVDASPTNPASLPDVATTGGDVGLEEVEPAARLLASLTDEQREVVVLRVIAGLSVDETAEVLGRRPGAVRALQHRALTQLRRNLSRP